MKVLLVVLLWCASFTVSIAQKEADNWYFGSFTGLSFTDNCQPTVLTNSRMDAMEACVTM